MTEWMMWMCTSGQDPKRNLPCQTTSSTLHYYLECSQSVYQSGVTPSTQVTDLQTGHVNDNG